MKLLLLLASLTCASGMRINPDPIQSINQSMTDVGGDWLWSSDPVYDNTYSQVLTQPISMDVLTLADIRWFTASPTLTIRQTSDSNSRVDWSGIAYLLPDPSSGGSSGVSSFGGRTGAVTPQAGDYSGYYASWSALRDSIAAVRASIASGGLDSSHVSALIHDSLVAFVPDSVRASHIADSAKVAGRIPYSGATNSVPKWDGSKFVQSFFSDNGSQAYVSALLNAGAISANRIYATQAGALHLGITNTDWGLASLIVQGQSTGDVGTIGLSNYGAAGTRIGVAIYLDTLTGHIRYNRENGDNYTIYDSGNLPTTIDSARVSGLSDSAKALVRYARTSTLHDTADTLRKYARDRIHDSLGLLTPARIGAEPLWSTSNAIPKGDGSTGLTASSLSDDGTNIVSPESFTSSLIYNGTNYAFKAYNSGLVNGNAIGLTVGKLLAVNKAGFLYWYQNATDATSSLILETYSSANPVDINSSLLRINSKARIMGGLNVSGADTVGSGSGTLISTGGVRSTLSGTGIVIGNGSTIAQSTFQPALSGGTTGALIKWASSSTLGNAVANTDYLPVANPTFTGTLTGPTANLTGPYAGLVLREWTGSTSSNAYGAIYPTGVTPSNTNFGLIIKSNGDAAYLSGASQVSLVSGGVNVVVIAPTGIKITGADTVTGQVLAQATGTAISAPNGYVVLGDRVFIGGGSGAYTLAAPHAVVIFNGDGTSVALPNGSVDSQIMTLINDGSVSMTVNAVVNFALARGLSRTVSWRSSTSQWQ